MDNSEKDNKISLDTSEVKHDLPVKQIQPDSTNQKSNNKKAQMKALIAICCIAVVLFLIILFPIMLVNYLVDGFLNGSIASGPAIIDYQRYLENKYGSDEGFYYADSGDDNCPMFDAGFCIRKFSTKALDGKTFEVKYQKSARSDYTDQYWLIRYTPQLDKHYRGLFDDIIPYKYSLSYTGRINDQDASDMSFEELLSSKDVAISITIMTTYNEIPDFTNIDLDTIKAETVDMVSMQETPRLDDINLAIDMDGSGMTGFCPNMTTVGGSSTSPILECRSTLYFNMAPRDYHVKTGSESE